MTPILDFIAGMPAWLVEHPVAFAAYATALIAATTAGVIVVAARRRRERAADQWRFGRR